MVWVCGEEEVGHGLNSDQNVSFAFWIRVIETVTANTSFFTDFHTRNALLDLMLLYT